MVENRKKARIEKKKNAALNGEIDTVVLNSGPPTEDIPKGYFLSPTVPTLTAKDLLYKKCMYHWYGNPRCTGWYFGTIVGTSNQKDCNFAIKFDRYFTKSVFVDGYFHYHLSLEGKQAYGLRWVVLIENDSKV